MNFKEEISFRGQTDHFGVSFTASENASCDYVFVFLLFSCFFKDFFPLSVLLARIVMRLMEEHFRILLKDAWIIFYYYYFVLFGSRTEKGFAATLFSFSLAVCCLLTARLI